MVCCFQSFIRVSYSPLFIYLREAFSGLLLQLVDTDDYSTMLIISDDASTGVKIQKFHAAQQLLPRFPKHGFTHAIRLPRGI